MTNKVHNGLTLRRNSCPRHTND